MTPDAVEAVEWLATSEEDGETRFRVGRTNERLVAEWIGVARLVSTRDGSIHELAFEPHVSERERVKLGRGTARLLLAQLSGAIGLHASAVDVGGQAIVFVGRSGQGKSTLAAAFVARGAKLLADDAVLLSPAPPFHVEPTEQDHWLDAEACAALGFEGSSASKVPVAAPGAGAQVALAAIVALEWSDGPPRVDRSHDARALGRLLPHVVRFVLDSPAHQRAEVEALETLVARVPVFTLTRAARYDELPGVIDTVSEVCLKHAS